MGKIERSDKLGWEFETIWQTPLCLLALAELKLYSESQKQSRNGWPGLFIGTVCWYSLQPLSRTLEGPGSKPSTPLTNVEWVKFDGNAQRVLFARFSQFRSNRNEEIKSKLRTNILLFKKWFVKILRKVRNYPEARSGSITSAVV